MSDEQILSKRNFIRLGAGFLFSRAPQVLAQAGTAGSAGRAAPVAPAASAGSAAGMQLAQAAPAGAASVAGATIKARGYAATDTSGKLKPWEFERRPMGDDDIVIDIRYASICHSDIHRRTGRPATASSLMPRRSEPSGLSVEASARPDGRRLVRCSQTGNVPKPETDNEESSS